MRSATRFWFAVSIVIAAAVLRAVPHPWNFTPVGAIALFAGATFERRRDGMVLPLMIMLLGDAMLEITTGYGFHSGMPLIYACFAVTVMLGWILRARKNPAAVVTAATVSATFFFIVTNFWVWLWSPLYSDTVDGLVACYVAALPFYRNGLVADLLYSGLFFSIYAWAERRFAPPRAGVTVR